MKMPSRTSYSQAAEAAPDNAPARLSVLVLDEEMPYPLNSGKRIRTWNLLRYLAREHDITLLCHGTRNDPGFAALASLGIRVETVAALPPSGSPAFYAGALANLFSPWPYSVSRHHSRRFARALGRLISANRYDLVHCEWTPYASYSRAARDLPMLVMAHNIEATVWRRRAEHASSALERFYMGMQAEKMARFERRCFQRAAQVAVVTAEEERTAANWGARATWLVANGVDTDSLVPHPEATEPNSLLFLGSLDWQPNRDALQYFLRDILPEIQSANPEVTLRVVGRQPATRLREQVKQIPGVEWVGEVADIRPYFERAGIVVVPLRIGGGSRIKILESLSMGKAVVTTAIGAEGLEVVSGEHCLIADAPREFAGQVTELLRHPERAAELGRNGRSLVVERYDWSRMARELGRAWRATAGTAGQQNR